MQVTTENQVVPKLRFGEFVSEWKTNSFGELLKCSRLGGNYANSENPTENPLIKMGNLGRGNISLNKVLYIEQGETLDNKDLIEYGDLFFNTRNTLDLVGKVAIWKNELSRAFYNSNLMYIKFDNNFFMNYRLNSFEGIKGLRRLATGTTSVAAIYTRDLLKLKLIVPSLPEQKKIASFLSAVDEKLQQLTKKKELLEEYKKGVVQKIFSQELRFNDDNGNSYPDWEEKKLGELCKITTGKLDANAMVKGGQYRFYTCAKDYHQIDRYEFDTDALIISGNGANVGYIHHFNGKFNAYQRTYVLDNFEDSIYYLRHFLDRHLYKRIFREKKDGATPYIVMSTLSDMIILLPTLDEQKKIAYFLTSLDKKIESVSIQIENTKAFKKGLLQQMFV